MYQPKGFNLPKVAWTDIRRDGGEWIRPRLFIEEESPLDAYWEAIINHYYTRRTAVEEWLAGVQTPVALCCWCPYDRAAKRQLEEFGTFICHTGPLGDFLAFEYDVPVWYDEDRRDLARPSNRG